MHRGVAQGTFVAITSSTSKILTYRRETTSLLWLSPSPGCSRSRSDRDATDSCSVLTEELALVGLRIVDCFASEGTQQSQISKCRAMSSFHNTQPRTREERLTAQNKELLEKGRLKSRPGHGPHAAETGSPLVPDPSSPQYCPNSFQRDVAGFIKEQKQKTMDKQHVCIGISSVPQTYEQLLVVGPPALQQYVLLSQQAYSSSQTQLSTL